MARRHLTTEISDFFGMFRSAVAVAVATRESRPARDADLVRLGIDPDQFRKIRRY